MTGYGKTPPPHHMIAFDPGKATGWALFKDGVLEDWGICQSLPEFTKFLQHYVSTYGRPDKIVYENFIVFKQKAHKQAGSKMEAPQAIGQIKLWAAMLGFKESELASQMSSILGIAQKWSGLRVDSVSHDRSHNIAAYNHGVYWLVSNDMMLPGGIDAGRVARRS